MKNTLPDFKKRCEGDGLVWAAAPPLEFYWTIDMKASRAEIWPYLSDTSRFNREIELAGRAQREEDGHTVVETTMLGIPQRWKEMPWTWITGSVMSVERFYDFGMAKHVRAVFRIEGEDTDPTRKISIYFGWTPKNVGWGWFLRATDGIIRKKFAEAFGKADAHVAAQRSLAKPALFSAYRKVPAALAPREKAVLENFRTQLSQRFDPVLVNRLCDHVESADELELEAIRVLELARAWDVDAVALLSICLHATQMGFLRMSWKVVCPHCRGSRLSLESLGDIPAEADCAPCDVNFKTDQDNAVEITFHPHDSVRLIEEKTYCSAEPAKKTHIKVQHSVAPGTTARLLPRLTPGSYRVRTTDGLVSYSFEVVGEPRAIEHVNSTAKAQLLVVEENRWEGFPLKPSHVLSHADFRDLFSKEHLRADVKLYLGEQVVVFTDIVGSTVFYKQVGDAKAFAEVRAHFREVYEEVRRHRGAVVKTIGDAVMAAFPSMNDALEGAAAILRRFPEGREDTSIRLRASVHGGPVIAVKLNTGIDYFGSTVNYAAKIQGAANASEIAMTEKNLEAFKRMAPAGSYSVEPKPNAHGPEPLYAVQILSPAITKAA